MAGSLNRVTLIGNLTRDPETRSSNSGDPIANLSVATNESWKDRDSGERKEKVEYHRVVIFGKLAGIAQQYLHKGSKVFIEGQLKTRKWTDQQGVEKYSTEIVLSGFGGNLIMLDPKGGQPQNSGGGNAPMGGGGGSLDDEIPFAPCL